MNQIVVMKMRVIRINYCIILLKCYNIDKNIERGSNMCESPERILKQIEKTAKILLETPKNNSGNNSGNTANNQQKK